MGSIDGLVGIDGKGRRRVEDDGGRRAGPPWPGMGGCCNWGISHFIAVGVETATLAVQVEGALFRGPNKH